MGRVRSRPPRRGSDRRRPWARLKPLEPGHTVPSGSKRQKKGGEAEEKRAEAEGTKKVRVAAERQEKAAEKRVAAATKRATADADTPPRSPYGMVPVCGAGTTRP